MSPRTLLDSLVYLDKGYIADLYEVLTGESPSTLITKNEGKKAGAQIPIFSAEISAQETRSFPVSTFAMLSSTMSMLEQEPDLNLSDLRSDMSSKYGWVDGQLTVFKVRSTVLERKTGEHKTLASDAFFQVRVEAGVDLALITTPEYFSLGLGTFLRMQDTMLKEMSLPIRAFVRALAAQSHSGQWVAVPLVVFERQHGG
jgi:hypothetical protein